VVVSGVKVGMAGKNISLQLKFTIISQNRPFSNLLV